MTCMTRDGVAQWLRLQSLAGGLFLTCVPDVWLTGHSFAAKLSITDQPTRSTQPSIHPESVSSNPRNYMEWRQLNGGLGL